MNGVKGRIKVLAIAALHLLLSGCFFAAATFFFRNETYSIAGILTLAGAVSFAIGVDEVKENYNE
jgi:NADH:ubiquinone oxidoreductase subunit 6 (subunit J)